MKDIIIHEENPSQFSDHVKKYEKKLLKAKDYNHYIDEMIDIIERNRIGFHNGYLMACILRNVDFDSFEYDKKDALFDKLKKRYYHLHERSESYWIVRFVSKLVHKDAYDFLIDVIKSEKALEVKANAMKSLAMVSKQPFDRNLPKDPGFWKQTDIRMQELDQWIEGGCSDGPGYSPPRLDDALFNPTNDFEGAVSKLNAKLINVQDTSDYSSYDNFLIIPNEDQYNAVMEKYDIQGVYAEFLKRFSPCKVTVTKGMYEILMYGVYDLIENQVGYAVDQSGNALEGWPKNYLVIADRFADPYCIDLTNEESKVFFASHGEGDWKFKKVYNSFVEFLEYLAK